MGKLILVGTSLGNIKDISIRAIEHVFNAPIILAEDTRVFYKLKTILSEKHPDILKSLKLNRDSNQKVLSYRDQNHDKHITSIIDILQDNDIVLVSDAGMPGISDPGWKLIRDVYSAGFEVDIIPGPTALTSALLLSGLPTDKFVFLGFLKRKKSKQLKEIEAFISSNVTIILYESPYRVIKTLENIKTHFENELSVSAIKDVTKKFQKVYKGTISTVIEELKTQTIKGEWVICIRS